ncbi:hypothetical protein GCM10009844_15340 [Nocardioides koreensis]|uniref:Uncharacterized protein n=1 Tax=Nocardioides koreensis TaxID=433651 RepID=A0ABN2ZJK7_9ACTN
MLDVLVEVMASLYARLIGRPWQRRRAERLVKQGKVRCVLFDADEGALAGRTVDGVAEVSEKRLRVQGAELRVSRIEGPPEQGPTDPFSHDGRFQPPAGRLVFEPRTRIYRLRLHNGSTVRWAVLAFQAGQALALLGLSEEGSRAAE